MISNLVLTKEVAAWLVVAVLAAWYSARTVLLHAKLRQFSGPSGVAFTNYKHIKAMLGKRRDEWYEEVSDKHGLIARISPSLITTSSPELWAYVCSKPGYKRSDWYYHAFRFDFVHDHVFSQTDEAKHDARRKQMAPGYSGRENPDLEPAIDAQVEKLIMLIQQKYLSSTSAVKPIDMAQKIQFFTLDVISKVGFGEAFGLLTTDNDLDGYLPAVAAGLRLSSFIHCLGLAWITDVPLIGRRLATQPTSSTGIGRMMAACYRCVDAREVSVGEVDPKTIPRSDMLASFMRHGLSGDDLRAEALEQVLAGSDTSATAIRAVLLFLMTNKRVYDKLQSDIDSAAKLKSGETIISNSQAKQLPYLQAVIRESLRMFPPAVNEFVRTVPAGGDTVTFSTDGGFGSSDSTSVFLPGGVGICYSGRAMHRSKAVYGADAATFRPERWVEETNADVLTAMTRTNDLIFGHGRHQCLGKTIGMLELNKVVFELLHRFDMAIVNPEKPWNIKSNDGLFTISDMWVQITERK